MTEYSFRSVALFCLFSAVIAFGLGMFVGRAFEGVTTENLRMQNYPPNQDVIDGLNLQNLSVGEHTFKVRVSNPYGNKIVVYTYLFTEPQELIQYGYLTCSLNGSTLDPYLSVETQVTLTVSKYEQWGEWYIRFVSVVT